MHITKFKTQACTFFSYLIYLVFWGTLSNAWAVQAHGGSEGLVSHQVGHILFFIGMSSLIYHLNRLHLTGPGWSEFKGFLWLILAWNVVTFSGHWMREYITPHKFIKIDSHTTGFAISNVTDAYFYLTRLDHLILVPAFLFLLFALKKWSATT